ncbi:hypothetical protein [Streptomyces chrestomyceticus]|uniref:hypothetical protein n=1 Tax=Streptomyces chrestomyceticus TaxID=68185 RepID=UPI0033D825A2
MTTEQTLAPLRSTHSLPAVFGAGAAIGVLGERGEAEEADQQGQAELRAAQADHPWLGANRRFALVMVAGSIAGAVLSGLLLGVFPDMVLIPALAVILLISAVKLARHD